MPKQNHQMKIGGLSIEQMRETFCFYVVELMITNTTAQETFYAGVCKLCDVFKTPDAHRNTHWREMITDESMITITVLATSDRIGELYSELSFFVKNIRPTANIKGYVAATRTVITCLEGPNVGKTWETQERASIENGISQPSLSNHLNGRKGYERIRGMRFKRGL